MEYAPIHLSTVNSSNSFAKKLLAGEELAENTVVITDYQDNGRGQGKNRWESEPGKNLLFTWIVFPAFLAVSDQFMLSKTVSLGIADAWSELGLSIQIKWPNDIICADKKLGGILIENTIQGAILKNSIVGIGLNMNQTTFPGFPFPATSAANETGQQYDKREVLDLLMKHLITRYSQLEGRLNQELDKDYLNCLYRRNTFGMFQAENESFEGKIIGVSELGELEIEVSGERRYFGFHSIKMIS